MAERKTKEIAGENGKVSGVADSDREGKGNAGTGTAGAETGGKTGAEEARQGVPKLAVVEVPGDEKPKEKKKTDTKKKKQTKEQRKAAELKELAGNLSVLIKTGFDMAAMRLGDVWEVTEEECKNSRPVSQDFRPLRSAGKGCRVFGLRSPGYGDRERRYSTVFNLHGDEES